eukprot:PITA_28258
MNSIYLVLSLAASFKWEVHQMDVKSVFLHGDLHEEIYMEQPPSFIKTDSSLVCQLKKSLYGLKQAPRAWYAKMDSFLLNTCFSMCHSNNIVYTKKVVLQTKEGISLSQSKYACDLQRHFHMENCKPAPSPFQSGAKLSVTCTCLEVDATLYRQLVGKILSLTHTHPDLSFVVGLIARFMQNPHESHWKAAKRILRYVQANAEYRGTAEASKEALRLRQILSVFGFQKQHPSTLWCDNQSAIQLCKDSVQHQRSKHIELYMHFIRKLIHDHVLEVQYCSTNDQVADIFTKALTEAKFTKLRFMVGVKETVTKGG